MKDMRDVPAGPLSRRPATRIIFGIFIALAYAGILAGAGFFISSAVNSVSENTAVARAAIASLREKPRAEPAAAAAEARAAEIVPIAADGAHPAVEAPAEAIATPAAATPAAATPAAAPAAAEPVMPESPRAAPETAAVTAAPRVETPPPVMPESPRVAPATAAVTASPRVETPPPRVTASPAAIPPPSAASSEFESRGDERLADGDVASARLFYERAADEGDGRAARRLGNSFDPAFLARWGVRGMRGDPAEAARWYRRAGALGDSEAEQDLAALPQQ